MKIRMSKLLGAILLAACLTGCGGGGGDAGGGQIDNNPPQVISTTPAHNSIDVYLNRAITVTFNEPIDPATVTSDTFIVANDVTGVAITGSITYEESSRTATLLPDGGLSAGTPYTATVTAGVTDLARNPLAPSYTWQFTTATAQDTTAPTVLITFPAQNSVAVPRDSAITVTFSEPINPATINAQTLILMKDGATPVAGSVTYVGTTALFKPEVNLLAGTAYTAMVTSGVKDLAGNALAADFTWDFTTKSEADLQAPQVLSVSPLEGAKDVPVDSTIVVTFNEPIMPFEFGLIDGRPVAVTFNATYTTVTMIPTVLLQSGTIYSASIRLQDMAGNPMLEALVWEFTTAP